MGIATGQAGGVSDVFSCVACIATGNGLEGFRIYDGKGHRIVNCYAAANDGSGIVMDQTLGGAICGCYSYNNTGSGIGVRGSHFTTVTGNICNDNQVLGIEIGPWGGIVVTGVVLTGNICHHNQTYGIRISANAHTHYLIRLNVARLNVLGQIRDDGTGLPKSIGNNII